MTSLVWTRGSNENLDPEVRKVLISTNEELVFKWERCNAYRK